MTGRVAGRDSAMFARDASRAISAAGPDV